MDYLDAQKELRHRIMLLLGYVLIAIAITFATLVLLYHAYGFGIGKDGSVIQNGLAFFSSQPAPANIYLNNDLKNVKTNTRLVLPAGLYDVKLTRDGYHPWQRKIELNGGRVQHYDYPFLFPATLSSRPIQAYATPPRIFSQSPDHRWLLVGNGDNRQNFQVYDLGNPTKAPLGLTLPDNLITPGNNEKWEVLEWANNNQHALIQHDFDGQTEFILIHRTDPTAARNLNKVLSVNPTKVSLLDKKFDRYYVYDTASATLQTASLEDGITPKLQHVLAYKSYGDDTILYATSQGAPSGKALVRILSGNQTYTLRTLSTSPSYALDLAKYDDVLYVAAGAAADNRVYIYNEPIEQLERQPNQGPTPQQVLRVEGVSYLSFSATSQLIAAQNAHRFAVYDFENKAGYNYVTNEPLDAPQAYATWMDGHRLLYVSQGKLLIFDYDYLNPHVLETASSTYQPAFAPDFEFVYSLAQAPSGQLELKATALLVKADQ